MHSKENPLLKSPLSRNTLAGDTVTLLKKAITSGRIAPGERLVEERLAEELGVSRVPVREALRQLKQEGLIVNFVHRGYFVPVFNLDDLEELFLVRMALERLAVQLAISRITEAEQAKLERIVKKMEAVGEGEMDRAQETEWDTAFHEQLCKSAHSQRLLMIWRNMSQQIRMAILASNQAFEVTSGFAKGHRMIMEAIKSRELDRATHAIEQHLSMGLRNIKKGAN